MLQGFLLTASTALIFGKFCLGSCIFHLIRGLAKRATATRPWIPTEETT